MNKSIKSGLTAGMLALAITTTALPTTKANAQTNTELQAQIQILLAKIQELQSQFTNPSTIQINLTRDLREGMSGSDVKALQQFLNSDPATAVAISGIGSKGNETTYFGPATKAAVIKFQNKYRSQVLTPVGLSYGTGFVGASTRAHINALGKTVTPTTPVVTPPVTSDPTPTTPSESIAGEEGEITVTRGSEHTNTLELSGDFDEVYSVQIKAEDSAMTIDRFDFMFDKRPWKYLDSFELYQDGKKIASMKAEEKNFTSVGNEYRLRFSGLDAVVDKDEKDTFVLEAKALKSLSGDRELDSISLYVPEKGIRAKDTAKIISFNPNSDLDSRSFDFRDAEEDGEITASLSDESPDSGVIPVKKTSNTSNVTVMVVDVEADDSDIEINDAYIKVSSSESQVTNVVKNLSLVFAGKTIATESVVKNGASPITSKDEDGNTYNVIEANEYYVHFDSLKNIEIDENDTEELTIKAEFHKQFGRYAQGTSVNFTLRALEGENSFGEDVVNGNITTGDNSTFSLYTEGLTFSFKSEEADTKGQLNRTGVYTITFDITAFGNDVYVPMTAGRQTGTTTVGSVGAEYSIVTSAGQKYALGTSVDSLDIVSAKEVGSFYKISEGTTKTVDLDISLDNTGGVQNYYRAKLEAFRFLIGSTTGTEYTITSDLKGFRTGLVSIKN